jgi:hypothetical protein
MENSKPSKKELIEILDQMVKNIEGLPPAAMILPINHYDFCSALIILSELFKSDLERSN